MFKKLLGLLLVTSAVAQTSTIRQDKLKMGRGSGTDKIIEFDNGTPATNPKIKWNNSGGAIQISNDGSTYVTVGAGGSGGGGSGGINILSNADFELGIASGWSNSGGSYSTASGANILYGSVSALFDASATSQYVRSTLTAIPNGLKSQNCMGSMYYLGGDALLTAQVTDGTNVLASKVLTTVTIPSKIFLNFPCPASGSLRFEVVSTGNAAQIAIDQVHLGEALNVAQISQAEYVGSVKWVSATNCMWSSTSNKTFGSYSADSDCTTPTGGSLEGAGEAPATKIPAIKLSNMKPGRYFFHATGDFVSETPGFNCAFRFYDGTNGTSPNVVGMGTTLGQTVMGNIYGTIEYTTGGTRTIEIQGTGQNGNNACGIAANTNTAGVDDLRIMVTRLPLASDTVVSASIPYQGGTLKYALASSCRWTNTSASYANYSADTDCGTPTVTGVVSAPATKIPGMLINSLEAGKYKVEVQGLFLADADCEYRLYDGTTASGYLSANSTTTDRGNTLLGYFDYTSKQSSLSIQIQASKVSGTSCDIVNSGNGQLLEMRLIPLSPSITMPNLVGSVTSNTSGSERIERAYITNSGTPTITSQSGTWISSLTDSGTGYTKVNIVSGTFSSKPACYVTPATTSNSFARIYTPDTYDTSILSIKTENSGGTSADIDFTILCMGAR